MYFYRALLRTVDGQYLHAAYYFTSLNAANNPLATTTVETWRHLMEDKTSLDYTFERVLEFRHVTDDDEWRTWYRRHPSKVEIKFVAMGTRSN